MINISHLILVLIILVFALIVNYDIGQRDMVYVMSDLDNRYYMVRNQKDKKHAANFLAKLRKNIFLISNTLMSKLNDPNASSSDKKRYDSNKKYILQLNNNIKNIAILESSQNSVYTSYTINKGEQIVFCIRSKSISNYLQSNNMHDFNLVMYVLLHEISHVACPDLQHTDLFKKIFRFICEEAILMGIYEKIDFALFPREYCGMTVNASII